MTPNSLRFQFYDALTSIGAESTLDLSHLTDAEEIMYEAAVACVNNFAAPTDYFLVNGDLYLVQSEAFKIFWGVNTATMVLYARLAIVDPRKALHVRIGGFDTTRIRARAIPKK
ncbi:MAG: hypothetical protein C5B49_01875 [Bdellovibrio sp.]|nr:MAG: hypothetical protein C5B49_01875 [Bdellovibrio sp.]